jgi:chloride channel protein, CIC family
VEPHAPGSPATLLPLVPLGCLAALVAAGYERLLALDRSLVKKARLPAVLTTVVAGLLLGATALVAPEIRGFGYDEVAAMLHEHPAPAAIALLLAARLFATPLSLAGGFMGGVFAPTLVLGAALGYLASVSCDAIGYAAVPPRTTFVVCGMAAFLAGAVRAPLTAALLVFESTGDYSLLLPLLTTIVPSLAVAERLAPGSVYLRPLAAKGLRYETGRLVAPKGYGDSESDEAFTPSRGPE